MSDHRSGDDDDDDDDGDDDDDDEDDDDGLSSEKDGKRETGREVCLDRLQFCV